MATIYAHNGDTVIIERRNYLVDIREGHPVLTLATMCESCGENDAADYEVWGHFICPRCINRAMWYRVASDAINHLMDNDDELRNTLEIMRKVDNDNQRTGIPYVDFHSASWDAAWSWGDNERNDILRDISESIAGVIESRVLVERA